MKIFSLGGLIALLIYYVVIDQTLSYFMSDTYVSPFAAGYSIATSGGTVDTKVTLIGSVTVLALAIISVYFTPRLF